MKKTDYIIELKYKGEEITVAGTFEKGDHDTRDTPGTSDRFHIKSVTPENDFDLELLEIHILETRF